MMMVEFVDQDYHVPYDPRVRTVRSRLREMIRKIDSGFPRSANSDDLSDYPALGFEQNVWFDSIGFVSLIFNFPSFFFFS